MAAADPLLLVLLAPQGTGTDLAAIAIITVTPHDGALSTGC